MILIKTRGPQFRQQHVELTIARPWFQPMTASFGPMLYDMHVSCCKNHSPHCPVGHPNFNGIKRKYKGNLKRFWVGNEKSLFIFIFFRNNGIRKFCNKFNTEELYRLGQMKIGKTGLTLKGLTHLTKTKSGRHKIFF